MAFRKEIFQKLREKHKSTPKSILEKVADHLEKRIEDESEIETAVEDADGLITGFATLFQSEGDRRAAAALKGAKPGDEEGEKDNPANLETGKDDKDTPAWAKALIESNKALNEKIMAIEQGKTIDNRKQSLIKKLEGVDELFSKTTLKNFDKMNFDSEEEFEKFLEEVENDSAEFTQNLSDKGLGSISRPLLGGSLSSKEASKEEVDSILEKII